MTHLIVIRTDHSYLYQSLQKTADEIEMDFQLGGKCLQEYSLEHPSSSMAAEMFSLHRWQDWIIALPFEAEEFKQPELPLTRRLTRRQLDVLCCLSDGMTGKQIASRLNIHTRSVSLHISALKRNLAANTAAECVQKAARLGILKPGGAKC
jgi:DNA-binding NarL/FixJ family response regulator